MLRSLMTRIGRSFAPTADGRRTRHLHKQSSSAFRPRVEVLESREVPASFNWTGQGLDGHFDTAANWKLMAIGEWEVPHDVPWAGDSLLFTPYFGNSRNCVDMHGASDGDGSGAYGSVTLSATYAATVTLATAFSTRGFTLEGGTINLPVGDEITVNSTFSWTGGVLNSLENDTAVNILGGGSITLPTNGTLNCGSSLYFGSFSGQPVTTTVSGAGTLNFTAGSPITIDANSTVNVATQAGAEAKFDGPLGSYDDGKAKIELKTNGSLTVSGAGTWDSKKRTFVNNGGLLEIKDGATARFGLGGLLGPPPGTPLKTDILQNTGTIKIHSGSTLESTWGAMVVNGGFLFPVISIGGGFCTIDCDQLNVAGDTIIRILNNYGTLWVTGGDFYWTGGKFQPSVNCAGAGPWQADAIEVGTEDDNWKLHVGGTATVEVTAFNVPPGGLPANFRASVIKAWGGILGIGQLPPSLTLVNPQGVTFQLDLANLGPNGKSYDLIPG
jgi:hypothetical protein